jgi:hypothetical protein
VARILQILKNDKNGLTIIVLNIFYLLVHLYSVSDLYSVRVKNG